MTTKADVFAAYGDNADDALRNWPQVDPEGYAAFAAAAEHRQYLADYHRWKSRQTIAVNKTQAAAKAGQEHLFTPPVVPLDVVEIRTTLIHDGDEKALQSFAGLEGAAMIRQIVARDTGPARTTIERGDVYLALADRIEALTIELGRPVSIGEVLTGERAA